MARSLSLEFEAVAEHRDTAGVRVVTEAKLTGIGLVDASPHRGRVELRHLEELRAAAVTRRLTASIPAAARLQCECSGTDSSHASFSAAALQDMAERINDPATAVLATWKDYSTPLAANTTGRMRAELVDNALVVTVDLPATEAADQLVDAAITSGVVARPYIDAAAAVSSVADGVRSYESAPIRALVISATDAREGWPAPLIEDLDGGLRHELHVERDNWARRMLDMAVTLEAADLTAADVATFPDSPRTTRIAEAAALAIDRYAPSAPDDMSRRGLRQIRDGAGDRRRPTEPPLDPKRRDQSEVRRRRRRFVPQMRCRGAAEPVPGAPRPRPGPHRGVGVTHGHPR